MNKPTFSRGLKFADRAQFREQNKQILLARDRGRERAFRPGTEVLGDAHILPSPASSAIYPLTRPIRTPIGRPKAGPLRRPMGETSISRNLYGAPSLWTGTPYAVDSLGETFDVTDLLSDWDEVGFRWNIPGGYLGVFLTRADKTWEVRIPIHAVKKIFANAIAAAMNVPIQIKLGNPQLTNAKNNSQVLVAAGKLPRSELATFIKQHAGLWWASHINSAGGGRADLHIPTEKNTRYVFSLKDGRLIKKESSSNLSARAQAANKAAEQRYRRTQKIKNWGDLTQAAAKEVEKHAGALGKGAASFVKDPHKWLNQAGKDLVRYADEAGKTIIDVASDPAFLAISAGLSAFPPLSPIGAAGVAAYKAANVAKPAILLGEAVKAGIDGDIPAAIKKGIAGATSLNIPGVGKIPGLDKIPGVSQLQKIDVSKVDKVVKDAGKILSSAPGPVKDMFSAALAGQSANPLKGFPGIPLIDIRKMGEQAQAFVSFIPDAKSRHFVQKNLKTATGAVRQAEKMVSDVQKLASNPLKAITPKLPPIPIRF